MTSQLEPSSLCNAIKMVTNLEAYSEGVDLAVRYSLDTLCGIN